MRPSVSAAWDLRTLLEHDHDDLVRGFMLLTPHQRAAFRLVLAAADSPGMSLNTEAEQAAAKVFRELEAKVGEFDAAALAEARRLLADARNAESQVLAVILTDRSRLIALAEKYGPEVVAAVESILEDLLSRVRGLFGLTPE